MIDFTVYGFSEESTSQINKYYDFTRCVRPDGTAYGTAGKCRKGTEEAKAEVPTKKKVSKEKAIKPFGTPKRGPGRPRKERAPEEITGKKPPKKGGPEVKLERKRKEEEEPSTQSSTKIPKLTDEKLKEAFGRSISRVEEIQERIDSLKKAGKKWDDPELSEAYSQLTHSKQSVTFIRQMYHAKNREEFAKAAGEIRRITDESEKIGRDARREMKALGLSEYSIGKDHPLKKRLDEAENLRISANSGPRDRLHAAYFGEPVKPSKLVSDGGGKVSSSVPQSLPKGGANKKLVEFLEGSEVVMAFQPKGFSKFVKEGEAKNGFEAGTQGVKQGRVKKYLENRMRGEKEVLGLNEGTGPKGRPVYAALEHPDRSRSLQGGKGNLMGQYGGIQVIFENKVKDRSSFTIGDSLDYNAGRGIMASPVRNPANPKSDKGKVTLDIPGESNSRGMRIETKGIDYSKNSPQYIEAQIHGGLKSSEIREVRYYKGHEIPAATLKALEKQGVKVTELPPRMGDVSLELNSPKFKDITAIEVEQ